MHWKPRRAGDRSPCLLLLTMGLVFSRWKTMGREYRRRCEKRFSSLSSRQSRREQDWGWRLWLDAWPSLAATWIGGAPWGRGAARDSASRCRWKKQGKNEVRKTDYDSAF